MDNKRLGVFFGLVGIVFIAVVFILIKDFNAKIINDFKDCSASINRIAQGKNAVIKSLSSQLAVKENENEDLKNTLAETRNSLEALSKKLLQPVSVAVSAGQQAPAAVAK
ncbi:MAG: hypothetical protein HQL12_00320 [Candidatus Omnitrophica bacterium]|nr:hypothetical protein [Candidatus Omnitrophota bacterium]